MPTVNQNTREAFEPIFAAADGRLALERLKDAAPVLVVALNSGGGQSHKVRHVVWSLYTCSYLVPLGEVCSGLDTAIALALSTAITARLLAGADAEEPLGAILEASGEFARRDRTEVALKSRGLPPEYPLPSESAARLRSLAEVSESLERRPLNR